MRGRLDDWLLRLWVAMHDTHERGQSTVEYAVVTSAIVVAALAAVSVLEGGLKGAFEALIAKLPGGGAGGGNGN
jgi:Flp pilus assembly pilin Flp